MFCAQLWKSCGHERHTPLRRKSLCFFSHFLYIQCWSNVVLVVLWFICSEGRNKNVFDWSFSFSIEMCKEVMDGLRVIFDFSLGANLLYEAEKMQNKRIMSTFHPTEGAKRESWVKILRLFCVYPPMHCFCTNLNCLFLFFFFFCIFSLDSAEQMALVHSPRLRSCNKRDGSTHGEPSPKMARLSPNVKHEQEVGLRPCCCHSFVQCVLNVSQHVSRVFSWLLTVTLCTQGLVIGTLTFLDAKEEDSDSESDGEETPSRRITRHAYAKEVRKNKSGPKFNAHNHSAEHSTAETNSSKRIGGKLQNIGWWNMFVSSRASRTKQQNLFWAVKRDDPNIPNRDCEGFPRVSFVHDSEEAFWLGAFWPEWKQEHWKRFWQRKHCVRTSKQFCWKLGVGTRTLKKVLTRETLGCILALEGRGPLSSITRFVPFF